MGVCKCPVGSFPETEDVTCKQNFGQVQKVIFCDLRRYGQGYINYSGVQHTVNSIFWELAYYSKDTLVIDFLPAEDADGFVNTQTNYAASIPTTHGVLGLLQLMNGNRENAGGESYLSLNGVPMIQISPFLEAPTQEPGEARTFGGGNDTPDGVEKFLGMGPTTFSAVMRGVPQSVIKTLKEFECIAQAGKLGVILVNAEGHLELLKGDPVSVRFPTGTSPMAIKAYWPIPIRSLRISDKIHGGYEEPDYNEISWQFQPNYSDDLIIVTNEKYLHANTENTVLDLKNEQV